MSLSICKTERSLKTGESSPVLKTNNNSLHAVIIQETREKANIEELSQGAFISPIIGSNPNSLCQLITDTFSPPKKRCCPPEY